MLTDTTRSSTLAGEFILRGMAGSLGFFGLLRLPAVEARVVLPLVRLQGDAAAWLLGAPALPVEATLACSGADALALCLGAVLAYPASWRRRVSGAAGGVALILVLNTLRIGTLGRAAASPSWFNALHLFLWPAVLTLAIAGYVFWWMQAADERQPGHATPMARPSRRFIVLTGAFVLVFTAASSVYLESPAILALAGFVARAAAIALASLGITAHAAGNVLWTARGGFAVTQECITTPLIPIYLAGVCAYAATWRRLAIGLLAALPLFTALGVARLLVVALPDAIGSPLFLVHAFYQLLLGAVVVLLAALWRHGTRAAPAYALAGIAAGGVFVYLLGPAYTRVIGPLPLDDPQGAVALLPSFQIGLFLALWVAAAGTAGWTRLLAGIAALGLTQAAGLVALHALAASIALAPHVRDIRAWAVAGPVLILAAMVTRVPARR